MMDLNVAQSDIGQSENLKQQADLRPATKRIWHAKRLATLIFILFVYCHQRHYDSATPASRLCVLHELWTHGKLEIGHSIRGTTDKAYFNGKFYSDKPPGMALAAAPGFGLGYYLAKLIGGNNDQRLLAASWIGTATSGALIAAVGGSLLWVLLSKFVPDSRALFVVIVIMCGAAPLPYATMMHSHTLVVGLICIAMWAIVYPQSQSPGMFAGWQILVSGICCGFALASEYTAGVVILSLAAYFLKTYPRETWPTFAAGVGVPLLLIPCYSYFTLGKPFALPYSFQASFPQMHEGLYAIKWPDYYTAYRLLLSPARGLFFWTPFLLVAGFGYQELARRESRLFWLTWVAPVIHITIFCGRAWDWPAGPTLGPRYLAPILPLLAVPIAYGMGHMRRFGVVLGVYSILVTSLGTLTDACTDCYAYPNPLMQFHVPLALRQEYSPNLGSLVGMPPAVAFVMFYAILVYGFYAIWSKCDRQWQGPFRKVVTTT